MFNPFVATWSTNSRFGLQDFGMAAVNCASGFGFGLFDAYRGALGGSWLGFARFHHFRLLPQSQAWWRDPVRSGVRQAAVARSKPSGGFGS